MTIIKSYLVRTLRSTYKTSKNHSCLEIEFYLKHNTPKKAGGRLIGFNKDYILEHIKYSNNHIFYYFLEVDKIKKDKK